MSTPAIPIRRLLLYLLALFVVWGMLDRMGQWPSRRAAAQGPAPDRAMAPADDPKERLSRAERLAEAALADGEKTREPAKTESAEPPSLASVTFWELYQKGGVLMYPISFLSFVVVCFGLERFLGLQRRAVVPRRLVKGLRKMAAQPSGLDPRPALELCERHSSAAASVVRAMLAKAGHPEAEVEQAVTAASEREAARLYFHVRWLNMAMSVAPMLGLLGTVQGMIIVFMGASQLPLGANKSTYMAEGIYLKLVCTFAGLVVAIPAAILSYLFEARIQQLSTDVEDLVAELLPRMSRFERLHRRRSDAPGEPEVP